MRHFTDPNKAKKAPIIKRNYSHKELIEVIDWYARFAKTPDQEKDMDAFIDNYLDLKDRDVKTRNRRNSMIMKVEGTRLEKEKVITKLTERDKIEDDRNRAYVVHYAKQYYRRNYSLIKEFKDKQDLGKAILKER